MAVVATMAPAAPAAASGAPDPGIAELHALLASTGTWTSGLATVGELARPVPLVGRSAGSVLGFPDLVSKAVAEKVADVHHWGDLDGTRTFPVDLGDGRTGTLTTRLSGDDAARRLSVRLQAARTLTDEPFSFSSAAPQLSLDSAGGVSMRAAVDLSFTAVVERVAGVHRPYLVAGAGGPSLAVDVQASLPATLQAAVGILGVSAAETPVDGVDASLHLAGSVRDPDADGRLYFERPDGSAGELAEASSLRGLVDLGFRPAAAGGAGTVDVDLALTAAPVAGGSGSFTAPGINATVAVDWADVSTGAPVVTASGLDPVRDFLRMSPRDLADMLGQLVTVVSGAQRKPGANLDLPFLSGTLADAVNGAEALAAFLEANVVQPPVDSSGRPVPNSTVDPATVGRPRFVSLQDLVQRLEAFSGTTTLGGVDIDARIRDYAGQRLPIDLTLKRRLVAPVDLAPAGTSVSGTGLYTPTTVRETGKTFSADLVGRRVTAGSSGGIITAAAGNTLTIGAGWTGGKPDDGTPYAVGSPDAEAGAVELANLLRQDRTLEADATPAIENANGITPTARVTPDYTVTLKFALDLSAPRSGTSCLGPNGNDDSTTDLDACPYERTNPDGTQTVVTSEPLPVERLLLKVDEDLLVADFPIEAGVDVSAKAGFLGVRLDGDVKVCRSAASADCSDPLAGTADDSMVKIRLARITGDPSDGYVPIARFFPSLVAPASGRLAFTTNVQGFVAGDVEVPGAAAFLGTGTGAGTAGFRATWERIGTGAPTVDVTDLSEIFRFDIDPDDPQALLGIVLRSLQLLEAELRAESPAGSTSPLDQPIPLVDRSLRELLGSDEAGGGPGVTYVASGTPATPTVTVTDASRVCTPEPSCSTLDRRFPTALVGRSIVVGTQVGLITARPTPSTLIVSGLTSEPADGTPYTLRNELADALSLLTATPPDTLQKLIEVLDQRLGGDFVRFEHRVVGGQPHLVLDTDWRRDYNTETPVSVDLGSARPALAGAAGQGVAKVDVGADVDVDLAVPLTAAGVDAVTLKVLDTSGVSVEAAASLSGDLAATLGPLSLSLGNPDDAASNATASARYRLGLTGAGSGAATTFTGFLSGATRRVNGYDGGVSCGDPAASTDVPLALCANLPLFASLDGDSWYPLLTPIKVRLPKAEEHDLFSLGAHSGAVSPGDPRRRLEAPNATDLANEFARQLLDFGTLGDGIDAFLALVERALNEASLQGKLPVAGSDLQAGTDFVGRVRAEVAKVFDEVEKLDGGRLTADQIETHVDQGFQNALRTAGANPKDFEVDLTCQLKAADVTAVTGNGTVTGAATHRYQVVAVGRFNSADVDTAVGAEGSASNRPALPSAASSNTVTWSTVPGATKYRVLRRIDTGSTSGTWDLVHETLNGTTGSWTDVGAVATRTGYPTRSTLVKIDECAGVPAAEILGAVVRADIGTGRVAAETGCTPIADNAGTPTVNEAEPCIGDQIPLDIGVPGLALRPSRAGGTAGLDVKLGWNVHLAVELDRTRGFSLLTKDQGLAELGVGLAVDLTGTTADVEGAKLDADRLQAELAFLKVGLLRHPAADPALPAFAAAFQVDLRAPGETPCFDGSAPCATATDPDARLDLAGLNAAQSVSDVAAVQLALDLHLDWLVTAEVSAALPGIQTRFRMDWDRTFTNLGATDGTGLSIRFQDVTLDAGDFLSGVLGPIVSEIKKATGPLQPVVDTLYAEIPVLSDLSKAAGGGPVNIVTLAKTYSTLSGGPDLGFVDTVAAVVRLAGALPTGAAVAIPIGSFDVSGGGAFSTPATPGTGGSLITGRQYKRPNGTLTTEDAEVGLAGQIDDRSAADVRGTTAAAGFTFPLLKNPGLLFNLMMNQDVEIAEFDSGPLTLAFTWRQVLGPVYAPPPVFITLSGAAGVTAHVRAGFDTHGLRKVVEEGLTTSTAVGVLNGLYFRSSDASGAPLPVITLFGEVAAGAAVSAVVLTVGVEGGVRLTVSFAWNDPTADGKFRLLEFGQVALTNPICLFQMSGRLSVFLRAYITAGVSPLSVSYDFTIADLTLLDFSAAPDCEPDPPKLGGVADTDGAGGFDTLVVFAADFGTEAYRGHAAWDSKGADYGAEDVVKVTQLRDFSGTTPTTRGVKVEALGISESWEGAQYSGIRRVVVDGRGYPRDMKVTMLGDGDESKTSKAAEVVPTADFDLDAVVLGGTGNDVIKAGSGRALVDGGGGNDTITTSDTPATGRVTWVAGGGARDSLTVGDADAVVAGDSDLRGSDGTYEDRPALTLRLADTDTVTGATRSATGVVDWDRLEQPRPDEAGTDGDDRLALGLGRNTAYGNGGADGVGVAADSELAGTAANKDDPDKVARYRAKTNRIVLGTGNDSVRGGSNDDTIWTATLPTSPSGVDDAGEADTGATRNVVDTGAGSDTVIGGTADDLVTGGSLPGQIDRFRGGAGRDVLIGGHGADELFGGPDQDWVVAEPSTVGDLQVVGGAVRTDAFGVIRTFSRLPLPAGVAPQRKLLVGGDGEDRVFGGDGGARIFGDRLEPTDCATGATGDQPESTPPGEDTTGTPGRDLITGGEGVDVVKAGGQADRTQTLGGADLLCGQAGADELAAGGGADTVWGGGGADTVHADAGDDEVYGNDGGDQLFGGTQADVVEGNDGADTAFGGDGDDTLLGGTRAAGAPDTGDTLYGDDGADVLTGDNGDGTAPADLDGADLSLGGPDRLYGGVDDDRAFGGLEVDAVHGGPDDDHLQGNHDGDDVVGDGGEDQLVGGSAETVSPGTGRPDGGDRLTGGDDNDLVAGDNAVLSLGGDPTPLITGRGFRLGHSATLLDLGPTPAGGTSGGDTVSGGTGNDVVLGQDGVDTLRGDDNDDLLEGGPARDEVHGGHGQDDLVGGSSTPHGGGQGQPDTGDELRGDGGGDVVLGDNGSLLRGAAAHPLLAGRGLEARAIGLLDLGASPSAGTSGGDLVLGGDGGDVVLAQDGPDRVRGEGDDDYLEGAQGRDWLEGGASGDDLVGGGYTPSGGTGDTTAGQVDADDVLFGGPGDDVAAGDNAQVLRGQPSRTRATDRVGTQQAGARMTARTVTLLDRRSPDDGASLLTPVPAGQYGADRVSGGDGVDVVWAQDGDDLVSGGPHDDYLEGNGGADQLRGDQSLSATSVHFGDVDPLVDGGWPGTPGSPAEREGTSTAAGQDDLLGGSTAPRFRDGADQLQGDDGADVQLGDNGSLVRTLSGGTGPLTEAVYTERYPRGAVPADATRVRSRDASLPGPSTRFCDGALPQCEPVGASGGDVMAGDGGDDGMWGQDGADTMRGGAGRDDMLGELGDDRMSGEAGEDVLLGDRGGVRNEHLQDGAGTVRASLQPPPAESYTGRRAGAYDRRVDLLHDTDGSAWVGSATAPAMAHAGLLVGGADRMRGGDGDDQLHGGAGDDLANGDTGGDEVFGGDGADVLWGGKGCDPAAGQCATGTDGRPDLSTRGTGDVHVDHLFGGRSRPGAEGADVLDWAPRPDRPCAPGARSPVDRADDTSSDPCEWFEMTGTDNADPADDQHHHGTDWVYGGWDRDVMQADVGANGPNPGDRLMDWNGAYNLYSHCNAAYGGFNDIREHSPAMVTFLKSLAFGAGAGRAASDAGTSVTSAFRELAVAYPSDTQHSTGAAFPTTPGHFDAPVACAP